MEEILRALCGVGAPSGFERPAVLAARELLEPLVDEIWIDRLGSLVGVRRCGKPGAKKLLLDAHLDEVGLVVTGIKDGFLRFKANGVDVRMLPDREMTILTQPPILGVVACLPPHVLSAEDREKAPEIKDLYGDAHGIPNRLYSSRGAPAVCQGHGRQGLLCSSAAHGGAAAGSGAGHGSLYRGQRL